MSERFGFPGELAAKNIALRGEEGARWLRSLPALVDRCAERWSLRLEPPFAQLSYNYAAPATLPDGTAAVLKVGYPGPELRTEIEALRLYDGHGAVKLFDDDLEMGALLLERLEPGDMLVTVEDDEQATVLAAEVMRRLRRPPPPEHHFPSVAGWALCFERLRASFGGGTGPLPRRLFERAEGLYAELLASSAGPVVLHGDLHHYNVLSAGREPWLAIDPKGVVGEPAYEVGALLRNQLDDFAFGSDALKRTARRIAILSERLGFERDRITGWGVAQAVLSACWTIEDGEDDWRNAIAFAGVIDSAGVRL